MRAIDITSPVAPPRTAPAGCASLALLIVTVLAWPAATAAAPGAGPVLKIDATADRHTINADIYGVNQMPDEATAKELRLPVRRWGGNTTSRYNWQNDSHNVGADWYFENIPLDNPNPAALPDGSTSDRFVEQNGRTATRTLMTVPMIGWVPKRRVNGHPFDCSFKVSKYGTQQATDPWDADCGNGVAANGSRITGNDPADTSTAVGPSFVATWVSHLVARYGTAANGGVAYYAFDNEPMLWSSTHRDVHPQPTTYDEVRDRTYQYGAAIKAVDPSARTFGPVAWGWCAYLYSAADDCRPGPDYQAHGSTPFAAWYLQQMRSYEQQHAQRILDYFDLHSYVYASGVSLAPAGSAATQALRLRTTRMLWDPTYIDESWVSDTAPGGVAIQLIPRMKQWVAANYPGTRLAITEYNWGGFESVNGALAQADVLGIFGREGLDLATLWGDLSATQPIAFAFRMFRNYDGTGKDFGDIAVSASSADQGVVSVYAARRSADAALTIMAVNKSDSDLTTAVSLAGFNPRTSASVYRYGSANPAAIERITDQPVTASGFSATLAASSITLFVLPTDSSAPPVPSAPSANYQGLWWNPDESGWGINFAHQGDTIFATWFTYDATGKPWWLIAVLKKTADGAFAGPVSTVAGPRFDSNPFGPPPVETEVGAMTVSFADAKHARIAYTVNGKTQAKDVVPQAFGPLPACTWGGQADLALATNQTDLWWNASEAGWGINFAHQGDTIFATWFTYDASGKPLWLIAVLNKGGTGAYAGDVLTVTGQAFDSVPWDPAKMVETVVGTATATFAHGNAATFAYTVNGMSQAKMLTRQVFAAPGTTCR